MELALNARRLSGRSHPVHLLGDPAAHRCGQPLAERLLQLQGDRALSEPKLLARQSLTSERGCIACSGPHDSHRDKPHSGRGCESHADWKQVHAIAVIRLMMTLPITSKVAASPRITQPSGVTNMRRK